MSAYGQIAQADIATVRPTGPAGRPKEQTSKR
jgi:hypothetical protein